MLVPGQIVKSTAGRDRERFFVVTQVAGGRAMIADGKLRRLEKPKPKNTLHLAPTQTFVEIAGVTDKKLRKILEAFKTKREGGSKICQSQTL